MGLCRLRQHLAAFPSAGREPRIPKNGSVAYTCGVIWVGWLRAGSRVRPGSAMTDMAIPRVESPER